ncbi:unnamed protein product [Heterobilharzia americana]|nr:unnamed protein product [Heterobilharzia americana]
MPPFAVILSITVLCFLMHHGFTIIFYILTAILSFIVGIFLVKELPTVIFRKRGLLFSKGIPKVTAIMDAEGVSKPNTRLSRHQELDDVLNQIVSFIVRDYITPWYNSLTPDNTFPMELHKLLLCVFANIVRRVSEVDWVPFLTETLPSFMAAHVRVYRTMLERKATYPDKDAVKLFFDIEAETEKNVCREEVCCSQDREKDHLRLLSDMFLFFVTPAEEYRVPVIRYVARELLVNSVLMPTINLLSDPDFVNRTIAWFASDSVYTSEYYCHSLRMSESIDEIDVVIRQLNSFMDKLRGHDTGGDDDALIKAQLGSLDYVRKICSIRRRQIQEGVAVKPERVLLYHLQPDIRLYDMSFQELMSNSVAVVSFLDFLTSIRKHTLLRSYLNCVSFREGASKLTHITPTTDQTIHPSVLTLTESSRIKLIPSNTTSSITEPLCLDSSHPTENKNIALKTISDTLVYDETLSKDILSNDEDDENELKRSITKDDDMKTINLQMNFKEDENNVIETGDDETSHDSIEQLRAFGITICSHLLHFMPLSAEPLIQRTLRTLTGEPDILNPNSFNEIETYIVNILSGPDCFGAFKQSNHYIHLLAELDLLKEPLEQSLSSNNMHISNSTQSLRRLQSSSSMFQSDKIIVSSKNLNIPRVSSYTQMSLPSNSFDECTNWQNLESESAKEPKQQILLPTVSESSSIHSRNTISMLSMIYIQLK